MGLLEQLGKEISLREKCVLSSIGYATCQADKDFHGNRLNQTQSYRKQLPTASTLVVENKTTQVSSCLFCSNKHFSASCTKVTDPKAWKKILRDLRRCFVCLRAGHVNQDCYSRSRCFYCQGRHHSSICGSRAENLKLVENQVQSLQIAAGPSGWGRGGVGASHPPGKNFCRQILLLVGKSCDLLISLATFLQILQLVRARMILRNRCPAFCRYYRINVKKCRQHVLWFFRFYEKASSMLSALSY